MVVVAALLAVFWLTCDAVVLVDVQVLDNHVIRYIPPEEYRHYPRYKWNRWVDRFGGVVVGALSMHPFQVIPSSRKISQQYTGSALCF